MNEPTQFVKKSYIRDKISLFSYIYPCVLFSWGHPNLL